MKWISRSCIQLKPVLERGRKASLWTAQLVSRGTQMMAALCSYSPRLLVESKVNNFHKVPMFIKHLGQMDLKTLIRPYKFLTSTVFLNSYSLGLEWKWQLVTLATYDLLAVKSLLPTKPAMGSGCTCERIWKEWTSWQCNLFCWQGVITNPEQK